MPYACCLTVTCINETCNSTSHYVLTQLGIERCGQAGLGGTILARRRRNLMNLYVTKIDDVVRDRSWSLDLTFFGCFFFVLFREKGNRRFFE